MYTLPEDFDSQLLFGCYLEKVCFGVCVTELIFARPQVFPGREAYRVSFCVESGLLYRLGGSSGERDFSKSSTSAPLLDFLLKDVVLVEREEGASLKIIFEGGDFILVEGNVDSDYESYSIVLDSGEILVV